MNKYSVLNALFEAVSEHESDDYSARQQAIKTAQALAAESKKVYYVRNDSTNFLWQVNKGREVLSIGLQR